MAARRILKIKFVSGVGEILQPSEKAGQLLELTIAGDGEKFCRADNIFEYCQADRLARRSISEGGARSYCEPKTVTLDLKMANLVSLFNHLLTILLSSLVVFFASHFPPITILTRPPAPTRIITPSSKLQNASPSAIVSIPKPSNNEAIEQSSPVPWGTTEKVGDHEYRTYVANDPSMGTPDEILAALNVYRRNHNVGQVRSDENICKLASWRAQVQNQQGNLDGHKGLIDYMNDQSHWQNLDIKAIGENASYGYVLSGTHLIEWVFDSDVEHRENQLNSNWNLACAGTSRVAVDIIFGQR